MNAGAHVVALLLASTAGCTSARPASPSPISSKPTPATAVQAASKDVYATLSSSPTPWFLIRRGDEVWFHGEQGELAAFDLATAKWERLRDLPNELADPSAAILADGRLLVIGQRSRPFPAVIGDGRQPWTPAPPLPAKADGPLLASLPDGRVIAVGGLATGPEDFASEATWLYDARVDHWAPGPKLPSPIMTGDAFVAAETAVVIANTPNALPRAFTFDRATSTWNGTEAAADLDGFAVMQLRDGRIALVGGRVPDPRVSVAPPTQLYDAARRTFSVLPGLPQKRWAPVGVELADGVVGVIDGEGADPEKQEPARVAWLDLAVGHWNEAPLLPRGLVPHHAERYGDRVFVFCRRGGQLDEIVIVAARASTLLGR